MSKKHKKSRLSALSLKTKVIAVASVLGVMGAVALTIWLIQINQPASADDDDATSAKNRAHELAMQQVKRNNAVRDNAAKALEEGGTERANKVYIDAIASEQDTTRKVQLAIDQSLLLYNEKQYKEAVRVAKAAESYSEDKFLIADWLSQLYESGREYKQAAKYYTLAGKWADSPTNKTNQKKAHYDRQAARVSALAGRR